MDRKNMEYELKGTALKVYIFLLKRSKPVGVREVQRALRMSSPSVANHHLEKLVKMGVVERTPEGEYVASRLVEVGVLVNYLKIGRAIVPRWIFYSLFFGFWFIGYLEYTSFKPDFVALLALGLSTFIFIYETIRVIRKGV
jgi:DNA-binding transcriptional ArsR family regulator